MAENIKQLLGKVKFHLEDNFLMTWMKAVLISKTYGEYIQSKNDER